MDELRIDDSVKVEPDGYEDEPLITDLMRFAPGAFGCIGACFKPSIATLYPRALSLEQMRQLTE